MNCSCDLTPIPEPEFIAQGNVGLAFGLTIGAGLCTTIGACLPFCIKVHSPKILAISLGASSGVMVYVSFVEIFFKSLAAFTDVEAIGEQFAALVTMFTFFAGVALMFALDKLVHLLDPEHSHDAPVAVMLEVLQPDGAFAQLRVDVDDVDCESARNSDDESEREAQQHAAANHSRRRSSLLSDQIQKRKLKRMGLMTAMAIGIHNLPEGLATFVAALADSRLGIALAIAIAIHNIPEGICVAVPIMFATGSKWRAFLWALLSGITEPVGALLGYVFLATIIGNAVYGVLFGLVSGMMIFISLKELLPTAHAYDKEDKYVTYSFVIGMFVIALSLVLFLL